MTDWITENRVMLLWIAGSSAALFVATLAAVPWVLRSIPPDYFTHDRRPASRFAHHHPVWRWTLRVLRAALALVFVVSGLAMLVLPGQGLLTLLVGFLLLEFPGKYRLEQWCMARPRVLRSANALRRRLGRGPMLAPPAHRTRGSDAAATSGADRGDPQQPD